jgi:hypothetical protein
MASCRAGNYLRKVSCRGDTQWHHVGQETICERFPIGVIRHSFIRTGNYLRKVSCRGDTP